MNVSSSEGDMQGTDSILVQHDPFWGYQIRVQGSGPLFSRLALRWENKFSTSHDVSDIHLDTDLPYFSPGRVAGSPAAALGDGQPIAGGLGLLVMP